MSATYHVIGIRPPDEGFKKMKAIWEACEAADVEIPAEVISFFNEKEPDEKGVIVPFNMHDCLSSYEDNSSLGYEVDLSKVPDHITVIRFTVSGEIQ